MITRYMTEVTAKFNPFMKISKGARLFISMIPAESRQNIVIKNVVLPKWSVEHPKLNVKFSTKPARHPSSVIKDTDRSQRTARS